MAAESLRGSLVSSDIVVLTVRTNITAGSVNPWVVHELDILGLWIVNRCGEVEVVEC